MVGSLGLKIIFDFMCYLPHYGFKSSESSIYGLVKFVTIKSFGDSIF